MKPAFAPPCLGQGRRTGGKRATGGDVGCHGNKRYKSEESVKACKVKRRFERACVGERMSILYSLGRRGHVCSKLGWPDSDTFSTLAYLQCITSCVHAIHICLHTPTGPCSRESVLRCTFDRVSLSSRLWDKIRGAALAPLLLFYGLRGNSLGSFVAPSWLEREQSRLLYGFTGCMTTCTPLSGIHSGHRVAWSKALGKATPKLSNIRSKAGCKHPELAGCCMLAVGVTYLVWRRWCPRPGAGTSSWRAHVPLRACTRGYPWTLGSTTQQVIEAASLKAMPSTGSGWGGVHSVAPSGHPQHVFQDVSTTVSPGGCGKKNWPQLKEDQQPRHSIKAVLLGQQHRRPCERQCQGHAHKRASTCSCYLRNDMKWMPNVTFVQQLLLVFCNFGVRIMAMWGIMPSCMGEVADMSHETCFFSTYKFKLASSPLLASVLVVFHQQAWQLRLVPLAEGVGLMNEGSRIGQHGAGNRRQLDVTIPVHWEMKGTFQSEVSFSFCGNNFFGTELSSALFVKSRTLARKL
eukprot:1136635-Pelagomonas_calceolata.AAC.4